MEVAPALISVHPAQKFVAVSIGSDLRVFDFQKGCLASLVDDSGGSLHNDSIRAIRFGAEGKLFVSGGDDKFVKICNTDSWRCIGIVCSEKRVSAIAVSPDGRFVCFADKFGVVWAVDIDGFGENQTTKTKKAAPILAHYCSIITSLEFSPNGQFIVSADRDYKIRVSVFPKKPLDGAYDIQSFCLGHTEFVSCVAFLSSPDDLQGFLVSGSGDSTVRLWEIISGSLLDICQVGSEAGLLESKDIYEQCHLAVTDLCPTPDGKLVAVAIQSLQGIMLLSCDLSARTLFVAKVISIPGDGIFIPTSLRISSRTNLLWMIMGASNLDGIDSRSLARVRVMPISRYGNPNESLVLDDDDVPGGLELIEKLQGSASIENKVFGAAAKALMEAMRNMLIKKQYSDEKREFRKRTRNDRKIKR